MIISLVKIFPRPEARRDVLDIFRSLDWSLNGMPGCTESSYSSGRRGDSDYFVQIALWQSEADLARFVRSSLFNRVMAAMELSIAPPDIRFHEIGHTRGMEYIESLRAVASDGGFECT